MLFHVFMHLSLKPNHIKFLISRGLRRSFLVHPKSATTLRPEAPSFARLVWLQVSHTPARRGSRSKALGSFLFPGLRDIFQIQFPDPSPLSDPRPKLGSSNNKEAQKMKS